MMFFSNFLIIRSAMNMVIDTIIINGHEFNGIAVVWNMFCNNGIYIAQSCRINDIATDIIRVLFTSLLWDLQLNTLNN